MVTNIFEWFFTSIRDLIINSANIWQWLYSYNILNTGITPLGILTSGGLIAILTFIIIKGVIA